MNVEKFLSITSEINKINDEDTLIKIVNFIGSKVPLWALEGVVQRKHGAVEGQQLTLGELVRQYGYNNIILKNPDGKTKITEGYSKAFLECDIHYGKRDSMKLNDLEVEIIDFYVDSDGFTCVTVKSSVEINGFIDEEDLPF